MSWPILVSICSVVFSIGGAWAIVKTLQNKVENSVTRIEFENLKKDLLDEIRSLRRMLITDEGVTIFRPRAECVEEKSSWAGAIHSVTTKLDMMDTKYDAARAVYEADRTKDLLSMSELKSNVALIEQRLRAMESDNGSRD